MAPDLDVLIRSSTDPLLFLEFHRQFTHSLFFIPIGGLICALFFYLILAKRWQLSFKACYWYCVLGYATHALLDACTTYGTQLFWPFSNVRVAWNVVSVVDPLYTVPMLILVALAFVKKKTSFAKIAFAWALVYPSIGLIQRERAEAAAWDMVAQRQQQPVALEAKPSFGNLLVWKIVYETDDYYHVDAVRVFIDSTVYPGERVKKLDVTRDFPWLDANSQQAMDIERFRWFSNGYVAIDPDNDHRVIDVRYSIVPNQVRALWGVELMPSAPHRQHVKYTSLRDTSEKARREFFSMLLGL